MQARGVLNAGSSAAASPGGPGPQWLSPRGKPCRDLAEFGSFRERGSNTLGRALLEFGGGLLEVFLGARGAVPCLRVDSRYQIRCKTPSAANERGIRLQPGPLQRGTHPPIAARPLPRRCGPWLASCSLHSRRAAKRRVMRHRLPSPHPASLQWVAQSCQTSQKRHGPTRIRQERPANHGVSAAPLLKTCKKLERNGGRSDPTGGHLGSLAKDYHTGTEGATFDSVPNFLGGP